MIEYRTGDLLKQTDLNAICHVANCQNTMGSGIAKALRDKWPQIYRADEATVKGDRTKMGSYSFAVVGLDDGFKTATVCNLYAQFDYGKGPRNLNYEALYESLERVRLIGYGYSKMSGNVYVVGVPHKIGCNLAGGSWPIVEAMLKDLFENEPQIKLVICKL